MPSTQFIDPLNADPLNINRNMVNIFLQLEFLVSRYAYVYLPTLDGTKPPLFTCPYMPASSNEIFKMNVEQLLHIFYVL